MPATTNRRTAPHVLPSNGAPAAPAARAKCFPLWPTLLAAVCFGLLLSVSSPAQVSGGSITGTVTDPTGAVVPDVTVKIVNRGTGIIDVLKTTSTGLFSKPNLDPGTYDVTFEANGFSSMHTEALVNVGHDTVLEMKLEVTTANTEIVNVTTASSSVDLGSTQLNQTVDGKTLRELPLNGRDWTSLSILEPNVHTVDNQLSISAGDNSRSNRGVGTQISIGGTRPQQNNYRLDGITTNDYSGAGPGGALGGTLGVDAIQEFTVVTSNATSDYGRTSGGVVSAVTREGTNKFHGTAYEFIRNSALDAKNYFSTGPAPFKRNQFGGTIGGPIHKDKAFFFFNYEGLRQSRTTATIDTVPSPNAAAGLLQCTQTATASNKNCLTGPGGTVEPANGVGVQQYTIDSNVAPYLAIFPAPNAGISGDTGTWAFNSNAVAKEDLYTGRADYTFSSKDAMHATALNDTSTDSQPDGFDFVVTGLDITRRVYSVQEQHVFSPNFLNFVHGGYAYTFSIAPASSAAINPLASNSALGFVPGANIGEIQIGGLSTFFGGVNAEGVYSWHYHSYQVGDDLYFTKGSHSLQAGFSYERDQSNDLGNVTNGYYVFGSYQSFISNAPTSFTSNIPGHSIPIYLRQNVYGAYAMDTYHMRRNLTFTVGARYEPISAVGEKYGHLGVMLTPTDPAPTVVSHLYQNPSFLNLSPRLGVVWDPFGAGKTSVRASFGIYDTLPLTYLFTLNTVSTAPFGSTANLTSAPVGSFGAYSTNASNPKLAYNLAIAHPTNKTAYIQQKPGRPYLEQYIFNIEQELLPGLNLEVGYTGSHGVRQPLKSNDGNIVEPLASSTFQNMVWPALVPKTTSKGTTYSTSGTKLNTAVGAEDTTLFNESTTYNALNVALRGTGRNYRLGISYTWGKSLDESSSSNGGTNFSNSLIAPFPNYIGRFKGPSDFNVAQNIVINGLYDLQGIKHGNSFVRAATEGYQLGGIVRVATGLPFTPLISGDPLGLSSANTFSFPDRLYGTGCSGNPTDMSQKKTYLFLNRNCFAYPLPTPGPNGTYFPRLGNLGRNSIVGPGLTTLDVSAVKNTAVPKFGELARVEFRAEAFNALNHPNFQVPNRANSVVYKASTNPAVAGAASNLQQLTVTSTTERQIQFGLKLIF
ncbi:MAG TPA: carboxypeptidase regulatory-like domain-containing protein [Terracidiphilus sp.]|nr:carboxypeptidase regulatory-like domain-containing protein [Terracidiphilus sp.]